MIAVDTPDMGVGEAFFTDGITSPPADGAALRFVHMCFQVPTVSIEDAHSGRVLISNISFMQGSPYTTLRSGTYDLRLTTDASSGTGTLPIYQVSGATFSAGTIETLVGIGGMGKPVEMLSVLAAASAGVAPVGGATTGASGLALRRTIGLGLIAASSLLAAASVLLLARRMASSLPAPRPYCRRPRPLSDLPPRLLRVGCLSRPDPRPPRTCLT